ncbi:MAG: hypothetical protein NZ550_00760 [Fimbriimonadales bacterium]|nr:hypothetical protein [Fimbriimonadales bacterium]MDW8107908.1 hypothetical protein [Armatimonadota bacterium]
MAFSQHSGGYTSAVSNAPTGLAFLKALEASAGVEPIAGAIEEISLMPRVIGGLGLLTGKVAESIAAGSFIFGGILTTH